jgi:hypothetical protein
MNSEPISSGISLFWICGFWDWILFVIWDLGFVFSGLPAALWRGYPD